MLITGLAKKFIPLFHNILQEYPTTLFGQFIRCVPGRYCAVASSFTSSITTTNEDDRVVGDAADNEDDDLLTCVECLLFSRHRSKCFTHLLFRANAASVYHYLHFIVKKTRATGTVTQHKQLMHLGLGDTSGDVDLKWSHSRDIMLESGALPSGVSSLREGQDICVDMRSANYDFQIKRKSVMHRQVC